MVSSVTGALVPVLRTPKPPSHATPPNRLARGERNVASRRRGAVARILHAARPDPADDRDARCHAHGSLQPDIRTLTHQTN
jgi:hypothetical protein